MYTFMQWKSYVHIKRNDYTSYKTQKIFSALFLIYKTFPKTFPSFKSLNLNVVLYNNNILMRGAFFEKFKFINCINNLFHYPNPMECTFIL